MTGAISQIQLVYNPEEDRILFRVNTTNSEEFRFWLTRRYTILMLNVLKQHTQADPDLSLQGTPEAIEAVKHFKQEKAINSANFKEQFVEHANELPLGQDALVAFRLSYNVKAGILNIGIAPKQGLGINMAINQDINTSLTQLLLSAATKGEWSLAIKSPFVGSPSKDNIVIN